MKTLKTKKQNVHNFFTALVKISGRIVLPLIIAAAVTGLTGCNGEVFFNILNGGKKQQQLLMMMASPSSPPSLTAVSINSDMSTNNDYALRGSAVTLVFTANEALASAPTVTINGQSVTPTSGDNKTWTAVYTFPAGGSANAIPVPFTITGLESESTGLTSSDIVTATTDSSSVAYYDSTINVGSSSTTNADEGTNQEITVSLSGALPFDVPVDFTMSGTATGGGSDYTAATSPLTITAGQTTGTITHTLVNDPYDEDDETMITTLSNDYVSGTSANTHTINDDDDPPNVSFSASTAFTNSEKNTASITFKLSIQSGKTVTINLTDNGGTATPGGNPNDYTAQITEGAIDVTNASNQTITFTPGQTTKTIVVTPYDDSTIETGNETIIYTLSTPINCSLGALPTNTFTIWDDDGPYTFSVIDASVTEGDSGSQTVSVTLREVGPIIADGKWVSIDYKTVNGTAEAGSDYTAIGTTTMTWTGTAESNSDKTFDVTISGDQLAETNETIYILLTNAQKEGTLTPGLTIADDTGIVIIVNNDTSLTISSAQTMDCDPVDGKIDHYKVTFSEAVDDSTTEGYTDNTTLASVTSNWQVAGYNNVRFDPAGRISGLTGTPCGTDSADDTVVFFKFDQASVVDTANKPELTAVAANINTVGPHGRMYYDTGNVDTGDVTEADTAGPYVWYAEASDPLTGSGDPINGTANTGDRLVLRFSETTNAPTLSTDLDGIFSVYDSSSSLQSNVFGAATDITSATWSSSYYTNDTLTITFATDNATIATNSPVANSPYKILLSGSSITDSASNTGPTSAVSPPSLQGTFDDFERGPRVYSAEYYDTDGNGRLDHVKITFDDGDGTIVGDSDDYVDDSTFPGFAGNDNLGSIQTYWKINGYSNVRIDTRDVIWDTAAEDPGSSIPDFTLDNTTDDNVIWLAFSEGFQYDTGAKPDLTATADADLGLKELGAYQCFVNTTDDGAGSCKTATEGSTIIGTTDIAETDKANPVVVWATARQGEKYIFFKFSEAVWSRQNMPACGGGGELKTANFTYNDVSGGDASSISSVATIDNCGADDNFVKLITDIALTTNDIGTDKVGPAASQIYDASNNTASTTQTKIELTNSPYVRLATSYSTWDSTAAKARYYFRIVFSEPMDYTTATTAANYTLAEDGTGTPCADISSVPASVTAVSTTVYDLESEAQCGTGNANPTIYRITAANVYNIDNIEPVTDPKYATATGTNGWTSSSASDDATRPQLVEAVSTSPTTVQLTFSEPMRSGTGTGTVECADAGYPSVCSALYTITPSLGAISTVEVTSNNSVFVLTHADSQTGSFHTVSASTSGSKDLVPEPGGNFVDTSPKNQATFRGNGTVIDSIDDGPIFADPFADGSAFSFAFEYNDKIYLGPNDVNTGAFRFEPDGANPMTISFIAHGTTDFTTFGYGAIPNDLGPYSEDGISSFNAVNVKDHSDSVTKKILFLGPINTNPKLNEIWFTYDNDATLNFQTCGLDTSSGMVAVETIYGYGDYVWMGIPGPSGGGSKVPVMRRFTLNGSTCTSENPNTWNNNTQSICPLGDDFNGSAAVGIDSMIVYTTNGSAYLWAANNGGLAYTAHNDTTPVPVGASTWSGAIREATGTGCTTSLPTGWSDYTLAIPSGQLYKIAPGQKGIPFLMEYNSNLYMARNVATAQWGETRSRGELWKCSSASDCRNASSWSLILQTTTLDAENVAVSMLYIAGGYMYLGVDNDADGARVYRRLLSSGEPTGAGDFIEVGRIAPPSGTCSAHGGDPNAALGGHCQSHQILSFASLEKLGYTYLFITTGCTINSTDDGICDTQAGAGFTRVPFRVLMQRE